MTSPTGEAVGDRRVSAHAALLAEAADVRHHPVRAPHRTRMADEIVERSRVDGDPGEIALVAAGVLVLHDAARLASEALVAVNDGLPPTAPSNRSSARERSS